MPLTAINEKFYVYMRMASKHKPLFSF